MITAARTTIPATHTHASKHMGKALAKSIKLKGKISRSIHRLIATGTLRPKERVRFPDATTDKEWLTEASHKLKSLKRATKKMTEWADKIRINENVAKQRQDANALNQCHFRRLRSVLNPRSNSQPMNVLDKHNTLIMNPDNIKNTT
jgi:hypothetical protein